MGATSPVRSYQDLWYLGPQRPVVIRLHLFVDGEPFEAVWLRYVRELFTLADGDGDGGLSPEELQSPPEADAPVRDELFAVLTSPGVAQADLNPPDGMISFDEFTKFVAHQQRGPFQAPSSRTTGDGDQPQAMRRRQNVNPGEILFTTLDVDRDYRVSLAELRAGPESIRKLDFDGDGANSIDELDHTRSPFGGAANVESALEPVPLQAMLPESPTSEFIERLMTTYASASSGGSESLAITQLGFENEQLARYDADGNARLDRDELRYFLTHPTPHVELFVRVGQRVDQQEPVEVSVPPSLPDLTVKTSELGLASIVAGDVHLEIGVNPDRRTAESLERLFAQRFKAADRDGNGYLESDEAGPSPLAESFDLFDRDGDGKVFEDEMLHVMKGRIAAALSRTRMTAVNRGKDLFEILDTNRDRRLTRRELIGAVGRFELWDADADEKLAEDEVPQLYQLVFDRGSPELPGMSVTDAPRVAARRAEGDAARASAGPAWFSKMDRNGDGDISQIEFLGLPRQFNELDADGNELLDPTEAAINVLSD